mmetsp:Transcript_22735/g.56138  ORF Transcript_22735/g.56138 Transcript_22735/m.56138 type:complete len:238 (+) Transcript_22735:568-1281(+)
MRPRLAPQSRVRRPGVPHVRAAVPRQRPCCHPGQGPAGALVERAVLLRVRGGARRRAGTPRHRLPGAEGAHPQPHAAPALRRALPRRRPRGGLPAHGLRGRGVLGAAEGHVLCVRAQLGRPESHGAEHGVALGQGHLLALGAPRQGLAPVPALRGRDREEWGLSKHALRILQSGLPLGPLGQLCAGRRRGPRPAVDRGGEGDGRGAVRDTRGARGRLLSCVCVRVCFECITRVLSVS